MNLTILNLITVASFLKSSNHIEFSSAMETPKTNSGQDVPFLMKKSQYQKKINVDRGVDLKCSRLQGKKKHLQ